MISSFTSTSQHELRREVILIIILIINRKSIKMAHKQTAHIFLSDRRVEDTSKLQSTEEQLELFALKYSDMDKDNLRYIVEVIRLHFTSLKL